MSGDGEQEAAPRSKPFRFKAGGAEDDDMKDDDSSRKRRRHHRHHHHRSSRHRSRRHKASSHIEDDPRGIPESMRDVDPDRAFRESLFDALGDDEGANFWEGVYGQPIHKYPNQYIDEETGELETMDEEEYAQYVRRKMWEKSREGVEAAREEARREKARRKAQEERTRASEPQDQSSTAGPHNNFVFDFEIEASLQRGQRRKDQKRWRELWKDYLKRWEALQDLVQTHEQRAAGTLFLRNKIAWPVESGLRRDVNAEEIQRFVRSGAQSAETESESRANALASAVKSERVRWHPDKIQQRYGSLEIDETTMKGVTATFQVLDQMWNDLRDAKQ